MPINKKTTHKKEYLPNIILSYTNDKIIRRNKNENKKHSSQRLMFVILQEQRK